MTDLKSVKNMLITATDNLMESRIYSSAKCWNHEVNLRFFPNFDGQDGAYTTRFLNKSNPALPYICRFIIFNRLTFPSTGPLLQGKVSAFSTAG